MSIKTIVMTGGSGISQQPVSFFDDRNKVIDVVALGELLILRVI